MRLALPLGLTASVTLVVAALVACPPPASPIGCGKDVDCKGPRICLHGACVEAYPLSGDGGSGHNDGGAAASIAVQQCNVALQDGGAGNPVTLPGASPMFHVGYRHDGRSRFRVSLTVPKHHTRLATGGTVVSSPAITDEGLAIFGSHDRSIRGVMLGGSKPGAQAPVEIKWTRPTGDLVWSSPALGPGPDSGKAAGTPTVYVGSDDDRLYALDSADGNVRWTFTAGPCKRAIGFGPEAARCDVDGVTVGPDGTIYVLADGLYALSADGAVRWKFATSAHCAGSPAVNLDGAIHFGCQDGRVYSVNPNGTKRWDFKTGDDVDDAPAVGSDGTIYVGSDDHKLYALSPSGTLRWAVQTAGDVRSSPAIGQDGTIYAGSFDSRLYAVHPDGTIAWTFATADRILSSPTVDAAGTILIGSQDDRLYAINPDGKLLWSVLLDGDVDGTAAIGPDGVIYVGSDDKSLHVLR